VVVVSAFGNRESSFIGTTTAQCRSQLTTLESHSVTCHKVTKLWVHAVLADCYILVSCWAEMDSQKVDGSNHA